jgi:hypothetical protein
MDVWIARPGVRVAREPAQGVAFHLLLADDPQAIPYRFRYELDVE